MLLGSMNRSALLLLSALPFTGFAQVHVDRPVVFTSTDSTQRQVDGIDTPGSGDALSTLGTARQGATHWATAGGTASAITLNMQPPAEQYANGMLVRWVAIANSAGSVTLNIDGLGPKPVRRTDLLIPAHGDMPAGRVIEAEYADSVFILTGRAANECPAGFLQVNAIFCVQVNDVDNHSWFQGVRYCADKGARLCTWDEYHHACMLQSANLTGMFDDWEWFDDTADHTHTAVQGGRYQCFSERSIGATDTDIHSTRCCYRLR